jgi:phage shock protein E
MKNITGAELREIVSSNNTDTVLIDVRTSGECAGGMIEGAINIDLMAPGFSEKITEMDKSKTFIIICQSGGRSSSACGFMDQQGFSDVKNLLGGMMEWDGDTI